MEPPHRLSAEAAAKTQATSDAETANGFSGPAELYRIQPQHWAPGFFASMIIGAAQTVFAPVGWVASGLGSLVGIGKKQGIQLGADAAAVKPFLGEATEELLDALSPIYDQLHLAPSWWFLEWMPLRVKKDSAIYTSSDNLNDYAWL
jgi:hypothetical protein